MVFEEVAVQRELEVAQGGDDGELMLRRQVFGKGLVVSPVHKVLQFFTQDEGPGQGAEGRRLLASRAVPGQLHSGHRGP